jgi:hypothetical protein
MPQHPPQHPLSQPDMLACQRRPFFPAFFFFRYLHMQPRHRHTCVSEHLHLPSRGPQHFLPNGMVNARSGSGTPATQLG